MILSKKWSLVERRIWFKFLVRLANRQTWANKSHDGALLCIVGVVAFLAVSMRVSPSIHPRHGKKQFRKKCERWKAVFFFAAGICVVGKFELEPCRTCTRMFSLHAT